MDDDIAAAEACWQTHFPVCGLEPLDWQVVVSLGACAPFLETDFEEAFGCLVGTDNVAHSINTPADGSRAAAMGNLIGFHVSRLEIDDMQPACEGCLGVIGNRHVPAAEVPAVAVVFVVLEGLLQRTLVDLAGLHETRIDTGQGLVTRFPAADHWRGTLAAALFRFGNDCLGVFPGCDLDGAAGVIRNGILAVLFLDGQDLLLAALVFD